MSSWWSGRQDSHPRQPAWEQLALMGPGSSRIESNSLVLPYSGDRNFRAMYMMAATTTIRPILQSKVRRQLGSDCSRSLSPKEADPTNTLTVIAIVIMAASGKNAIRYGRGSPSDSPRSQYQPVPKARNPPNNWAILSAILLLREVPMGIIDTNSIAPAQIAKRAAFTPCSGPLGGSKSSGRPTQPGGTNSSKSLKMTASAKPKTITVKYHFKAQRLLNTGAPLQLADVAELERTGESRVQLRVYRNDSGLALSHPDGGTVSVQRQVSGPDRQRLGDPEPGPPLDQVQQPRPGISSCTYEGVDLVGLQVLWELLSGFLVDVAQ